MEQSTDAELMAKLEKLEQRHQVVSKFIAQFAAAVARDGLNNARVDEIFRRLRPQKETDDLTRLAVGFEVNFLEEEFKRWAPR